MYLDKARALIMSENWSRSLGWPGRQFERADDSLAGSARTREEAEDVRVGDIDL